MPILARRPLPTPAEIRAELPVPPDLAAQISRDRDEIAKIIRGEDPRRIFVVGPCSAWPAPAVLDFAEKLAPVARDLEKSLKIVLRVYTQKPRTRLGWTGPAAEPDPFGPPDFARGIRECRAMMLAAIRRGLPVADEILFSGLVPYFSDLLAWGAVGARSGEDQEHRALASAVDFPVGVKNPTAGDLPTAANGVVSAGSRHGIILENSALETGGNPAPSLVLRGTAAGPNLDPASLRAVLKALRAAGIARPAVVADLSHGNSLDPATGQKSAEFQPRTLEILAKNLRADPALGGAVRGFMAEGFLENGAQNLADFSTENPPRSGVSVTDPCLGWPETEKMLRAAAGV